MRTKQDQIIQAKNIIERLEYNLESINYDLSKLHFYDADLCFFKVQKNNLERNIKRLKKFIKNIGG